MEALRKVSCLVQSLQQDEEGGANGLVELVSLLESEEEEVVMAALRGLLQSYRHLMEKDSTWLLLPARTKGNGGHGDVVAKYRTWMRELYSQCQDQLLVLVLHPQQAIAELAVNTIFQLLVCEGRGCQKVRSSYQFPNASLYSLVSVLLDKVGDHSGLVETCKPWLDYHDVLFHWLKNIASVIGTKINSKNVPLHEAFVSNVYSALNLVSMPTSDEQLSSFLAGEPPTRPQRQLQEDHEDAQQLVQKKHKRTRTAIRGEAMRTLERYKKQFSDAWLGFLRLPLSPHMLQEVLVQLHGAVMPHLLDPRLLLDFLTCAYDQGGVVSLLSLNGLFLLMNNFHLDYPSFYPKLYQLLTVSVLHVKYTPRFLILLDTFLSSTLLPLYLVAAFMKKLSRLALSAPAQAVVAVVMVVTNLLKRHPNCQVLLHRPSQQDYTFTSDPFILDEPDPAKSCALESCLWELKDLCRHYSPSVCLEVEKLLSVETLLCKQEAPLARHLATKKGTFHDQKVMLEDSGEAALHYKEPIALWQ